MRIDEENDDVGEIDLSYCFDSIIGRLIVETNELLRRGVRLFTEVFFIINTIEKKKRIRIVEIHQD